MNGDDTFLKLLQFYISLNWPKWYHHVLGSKMIIQTDGSLKIIWNKDLL